MSEVLVRQLQQVLAPWDSLSDGNEAAPSSTAPQEPAFDSWGSASAQDALTRARAATTKIELARAALALFTSNAGAFRPVLVKVFRFLFDHVDQLRDEVAHNAMERLLWQQGESVRAAAATGPASKASELGGTPEEQSAIVTAYEKVRLTESRMAALVEEASVQRDHFKSQIEAQKKQQYHLEDLLQHQMELTQTLLDHRLRQELVGGGPSAAQSSKAGEEAAGVGTAAPSGAMYAMRLDANRGGDTAGFSAPSSDVSPPPATERKGGMVDVDMAERTRRPAERRDAAYVQRLIQRANREFTLEKTEDQLREMRAHRDELDNKIQSLLKLNTKYARQCVELSTRLSIIHENNIALASDVHLFQRDYFKDQQRLANLQHALHVARGIVLTILQVQPGYQTDEMMAQLEMLDKTSAGTQLKPPEGDNSSLPQHSRWDNATPKPLPTSVNTENTDNATSPTFHPDAVDAIDEALRVVPEPDLRRQLLEILQLDDVDYCGRIKVSLLRLLDLQTRLTERLHDDAVAAAAKVYGGWLAPPCTHGWAPPYGLRPSVPRHLRSATAVPLLFLHPILAEVFVHELLTQRQHLLAYAQAQYEQAKLLASTSAGQTSDGGVPAKAIEMQQCCIIANSIYAVPLPDFIELFILVVWLNRADRYLPLLPSAERTKLEEEAQVRAEARARRASRVVVKGIAPTGGCGTEKRGLLAKSKDPVVHTSLWELRKVLHLMRPSSELAPLPFEGLQLTYALDMASHQVDAGPLTYAYGLTSRGTLCEALLYLLRAEREILLRMCRTVDAAMLAHARGKHSISTTEVECSVSASAASTASKPQGPGTARNVNGWIPTVHFVRILLTMYPGYAVGKLEQLIEAAVSDGTEGAESPATLFYEVLLPGRVLPGPTAATTSVETSIANTTKFSSFFYAAICDDALASMQMVEDSVDDFVRGQQQVGAETAGHTSSAAAAGDSLSGGGGMTSVTARQITTYSFFRIPRLEGQQWGAGLRSAINRWPRLRSTIADPGKGAMDNVQENTRELTEADQVSLVARVPAEEVMPYLRNNVIVRRGFFANSETVVTTAASVASPVGSPISVPKLAVTNESSTTSKVSSNSATITEKSSTKGSSTSELLSLVQSEGWTPTQARLLQQWEVQWAQYGNHSPASSSLAAGVIPSRSLGAPSQMTEYTELLQRLDPHRSRPWGSELVSRDNAVLHPLDYTGDWPPEALDILRRDDVGMSTSAALKHETAKTGKRARRKLVVSPGVRSGTEL
ncbi:hypothetical protein ABL78_6279 [Leptomonas seymouri]|uniref:Uncharacterized protein n=1 Tax=Leptomonas seymouri TaxID=5684 RepID=A0A0N1I114_LEPSE|nr:hypothetical protein ABL78_6279 [Leptomonas seymouri]|eukprot:KPI84663.1 hypothetical protein ABL78_6279 [Leptomonas seymouri]